LEKPGAWPFLVGGVICLVKKKKELARNRCCNKHLVYTLDEQYAVVQLHIVKSSESEATSAGSGEAFK